jgi:hypothetical protein
MLPLSYTAILIDATRGTLYYPDTMTATPLQNDRTKDGRL